MLPQPRPLLHKTEQQIRRSHPLNQLRPHRLPLQLMETFVFIHFWLEFRSLPGIWFSPRSSRLEIIWSLSFFFFLTKRLVLVFFFLRQFLLLFPYDFLYAKWWTIFDVRHSIVRLNHHFFCHFSLFSYICFFRFDEWVLAPQESWCRSH